LERVGTPKWRNLIVVTFIVAYSALSIVGYLNDPGTARITIDRYLGFLKGKYSESQG